MRRSDGRRSGQVRKVKRALLVNGMHKRPEPRAGRRADRQLRIERSRVGGAIALLASAVVGALALGRASVDGGLVAAWAGGLLTLAVAQTGALMLERVGEVDSARQFDLTGRRGAVVFFAMVGWLDLDATGHAPGSHAVLAVLLMSSLVAVQFAPRRSSIIGYMAAANLSTIAAFLVAGETFLAALGVIWAGAGLVIVHLIHQKHATLLSLRDQVDWALRHDSLTGLLNREEFIRQLDAEMDSGNVSNLVIVDLNRFTVINDAHGHAAGDEVLRAVSERLDTTFPITTAIGRMAGDQFGVLTRGGTDMEFEVQLNTVLFSLAQPIIHDERELRVTASIGVTRVRPDCSDDDLLAEAAAAVSIAKRSGENRAETFDDGMRSDVVRRADLEQQLRYALENREIEFYGQPIVRATDQLPSGTEMLARWPQPDGSFISPGEFVPIAEETGLIQELDRQSLETAARLLAVWAGDPELSELTVNVNISPRHLDENLTADLREALRGVPNPELLGIEFEENELIKNFEDHVDELLELKGLGVRLVIDDFGVGNSSLTYLRSLPVTNLKIDMSFVREIDRDLAKQRLMKAVIDMTASLDLPVVAEGVETPEELETLVELGVEAVQGFGVSRPAPLPELDHTLRRMRRSVARKDGNAVQAFEQQVQRLRDARTIACMGFDNQLNSMNLNGLIPARVLKEQKRDKR